MYAYRFMRRWYNIAMSLTVHALASGSSGNSTLIAHRAAGRASYVLIDAGLTIHGTEYALARYGVHPDMLSGIVMTHEHTDHAKSAYPLARKYGVPLVANERTLNAMIGAKKEIAHEIVSVGGRIGFGAIEVETFPVPHDAADPVGVNVYADGYKVSQVTDAGCITPAMRAAMRRANLVILEANHDVHRLKTGPYPDILKRRILSDRGHLSNETAVGFLVDHLLDMGPCAFWLAHLSKTNNLPKLAMNYAKATLTMATRCPFVLEIALRDKPSVSWSPGDKAVQLNLFQ
jgi:phosphoribosyl 1,2-cyclic phosphodiesterase